MSKYIGTPVVNISADTVDVTGDITTTDATPEVIIVNDTHEDTDGGREGKVTFKGQQSGGEETTLAQIQASHDGASDDEKGDLIFKTNDGSDGASPTTAMTIDSSQHVGIGNSTPSDFDAAGQNLVVGTGTGNNGITVFSGTSNAGSLFFADGTGSAAAKADGYIQYDHNNQKLTFGTNDGTAQVRIDSDGKVGIGTATPSNTLDVERTTGTVSLGLQSRDSSDTKIDFGDNSDSDIGQLIYRHSTDNMLFTVNANEVMRIDENGALGIGSTNPLSGLEVKGDANNGDIITVTYTGTSGGHNSGIQIRDKRDQINAAILNNLQSDASGTFGAHLDFQTSSGGTLSTNMRIKDGGDILFGGATSTVLDGKITENFAGNARRGMTLNDTTSTNTVNFLAFALAGSEIGKVQKNSGASTVNYSTTSDYRLKENEENISDGITRVKQLKPYKFNWKAYPEADKVDGFFAHEVQVVVPEAVNGEKDAMTNEVLYVDGDEIPEGKKVGDVKTASTINPQGIDPSKLVPLLTAALQEAIAKIETLETKVAALEGE